MVVLFKSEVKPWSKSYRLISLVRVMTKIYACVLVEIIRVVVGNVSSIASTDKKYV